MQRKTGTCRTGGGIKIPNLTVKSGFLTKLIVREHHCLQAHMGVNATVASVRQEYWVPQLRQLSKSVIHHRIFCKKTQGRPFRVNIAPPLPEFRVQRKQPFSITGVDYTGALLTKEKQQNPEKAYIVLFTCPVTRGIHIELVKDLPCNSFLRVFQKFCGRRGFPSLMLSDNATTFLSTSVYLKNMAETSLVQEHLNAMECKWKFIPERAPWFGAIWERLIGLLKTCLNKAIGQAFLSFSELSCVVTELEAIINDTPLSYTSGDLDQWEREYLISLRETHRVGIRHESWPKMGDVVLIHDEGPRSRWKLGKNVKLHVGPDDVSHVVTLKTPQGQVMRPVVKLYPLELWQETDVVISEKTDNKSTRPSRKTAQAATEARRALIRAGQL
ncbi:uncharacterized protein [Palaemon carinicauda]|uniref:uncharacterized protein n=1 Tax=Palaemon carinicauda TaxID=392227 RepID=UPI0035B69D3B